MTKLTPKKNMRFHLAIDASNISSGGGLTHLSQLLDNYDSSSSGIKKMTIWSNNATANYLPNHSWLIKRSPSWCERNIFIRFFCQQFLLLGEMKRNKCEILFSPGGTIPFNCPLPVVTMSQNMLPFEEDKANHFGRLSIMRVKMLLLKFVQGKSFKVANGVILCHTNINVR